MNARLLELPTEDPSLVLRELGVEDAPVVLAAVQASVAADPDHFRFARPIEETMYADEDSAEATLRETAEREEAKAMGIWLGDALIGAADLSAYHVGIWVGAEHTRKGYATLGTRAITAYGLRQYPELRTGAELRDERSLRLLAATGFKPSSGVLTFGDDFEHSSREYSIYR